MGRLRIVRRCRKTILRPEEMAEELNFALSAAIRLLLMISFARIAVQNWDRKVIVCLLYTSWTSRKWKAAGTRGSMEGGLEVA